MAESSLSLTFSDIQSEVALFLGWDRTSANWTTGNNTDFTFILERGLRSFYYPVVSDDMPEYEWSFLRKEGSITLATNDFDYDLPDDFSGSILDDSVTNAAGSNRKTLQKIPEADIRKHRSITNATGVPLYYAVRNKTHAPTTGQRYEILVYPAPTVTQNGQVLTFRYVFIPDTITSVNLFPVGGGRHSETLLAAMLASAEEKMDDDNAGIYNKKFRELLQISVRADKQMKSNERGGEA